MTVDRQSMLDALAGFDLIDYRKDPHGEPVSPEEVIDDILALYGAALYLNGKVRIAVDPTAVVPPKTVIADGTQGMRRGE